MMRRSWCIFLLLAVVACQKTAFDIDPSKVYSPVELIEQTQGKCNKSQPWADKMVTVSGLISQPSSGRFQLLDEQMRTPIPILIQPGSPGEIARLESFIQQNVSKKATVTGVAKADQVNTQLRCRIMIFILIGNQAAIKL